MAGLIVAAVTGIVWGVRPLPALAEQTDLGTWQLTPLSFAGRTTAATDVVTLPDGGWVTLAHSSDGVSGWMVLAAYQADGTPNAGFGTGGQLVVDSVDITDAGGLARMADGRLVAVGTAIHGGREVPFVLRANADGSLDTTFNGHGWRLNEFWPFWARAHAVAIQPDGKIVVGGSARSFWTSDDSVFLVARYLTTGLPDTTFGGLDPTFNGLQGYVVRDLSRINDESVNALLVQADGRIVAAGGGDDDRMHLLRLLPNGAMDTSFGGGSGVVTDYGVGPASAVRRLADGTYLVAGNSPVHYKRPYDPFGTYGEFDKWGYVQRHLADGAPDYALRLRAQCAPNCRQSLTYVRDVEVLASGKFAVAGFVGGQTRTFAVAIHNPDGSWDSGTGEGGLIRLETTDPAVGTAIAAAGASRLVVAGFGGADGLSGVIDGVPSTFALSFTSASFLAAEGAGVATIGLRLGAPQAGPVTVTVETADGTATAGLDYVSVSTEVTFAPGETLKSVEVPILGDSEIEAAETVTLTLSAATGATLGNPQVATLTIEDSPRVSVLGAPAYEGSGVARAWVTLSGPTVQPVTVSYSFTGGTATPGLDFDATPGQVTISPGAESAVIEFPLLQDGVAEPEETILLSIHSPVNASLDPFLTSATVTVVDNIAQCTQCPVVTVSERDGQAQVQVSSSAGSGYASFQTLDGTATAGLDYTARVGGVALLTNLGGEPIPQTISIPIQRDSVYDPDETFVVAFSGDVPTVINGYLSPLVLVRITDGAIVVGTTEQAGGPCSLTSAIRSANGNTAIGGCLPGVSDMADLIVVPAGNYALSSVDHVSATSVGGPVGLPAISSPLVIEGVGADETIIARASSAPAFRLLEVLGNAGSQLTLRRLTLKGGHITQGWSVGGAIYAEGSLVVEDARFDSNRANQEGGAVYAGVATFRRTSFIDNVAHVGGAIRGSWLTGLIVVEDSRFERNRASHDAGALAACGSLTIDRGTFAGNTALKNGGAVLWSRCGTGSASFTLRDSEFIDNLAGPGDVNATGGAVALGHVHSATIERTRFIGNVTGGTGGAIKAAGGLIADSYFSRNRALRGGAATSEGAALEVHRSTFEGNEAGDYGGAFLVQYAPQVTFTNVTITGNTAASQGGGIAYADASGSQPLTLQNVTIADNHAGWRGGGIWFYHSGYEIRLRNTIVARNTSGSTNWPDLGSDGKAYTSQGYNLIGNRKHAPYTPAATDIAGTDAAPVDPRLGPLAGYGGLTPTRALLDGSPALGAGNPLMPGADPLACAATDQRGFARPGAGSAGCDIGAFERTSVPGPALAVSKTQTDGVAYVGQPVTYRITLVNNGDESVTGVVATDQAPAGLFLSNATSSQGTCQVAGSLASCDVGVVAPGGLVTIDVTGVALEPGVIVNGVQVTADASAGLPPGGLTAAAPVSSRTPIVVTTLAQSPGSVGDCTLGEAIQAANTDTAVDGCVAGHGRDLILLPSGTLLMTAVAHSDGQGATALPIITAPVEIRGQGPDQTIVQRDSLAPDMRLFRATSDVTVSHLTVRGGRSINANGGAWFGGALGTEHVRFENNYTNREGGAVATGTFVARDTRFASNHAAQVGGAATVGTARLRDTVFASNRSDVYGGALNVCQEGDILRTVFESNQATNSGGAIYANCNTTAVRLTDSVFVNNQAAHGGAAHGGGNNTYFGILRTQFLGNRATGNGGAGGALANVTTVIADSAFSGNTAGYGGAIRTSRPIAIAGSTIDANEAWEGGGLYLSEAATIVNTTITENRATNRGAGIFSEGALTRAITLNNVTLSHNVAATNFGGLLLTPGTSNVRVANSIVAANVGGGYAECYNTYPIISEGHNLVGNVTNCWFQADPTDQVGTAALPIDPGLGPLANNGGPTLTRALLPGSPALDAGSPLLPGTGLGSCMAVDQRGVPRPGQGTARCDVGAFEAVVAVAGADLSVEASLSGAAESGVEVTYTVLVRNLGPDTAFASNVTVQLPEAARIVSATTTQGVTSRPGRQVIFHLGSLAPGATATVAVTLVPTAIGAFEILTSATSAVGDPDASNNATVTALPVGPATELVLQAVAPARGGNKGRLIITAEGVGFLPGAEIRLRRPDGTHLRPIDFGSADNGLSAGGMFDLTDEETGRWDVLVMNPDGQIAVLGAAFAVEVAREARLTVDIVGPSSMRLGQEATFEYVVTNVGDADVYGVELDVRVPGFSIRFPNPPRFGPLDDFFGEADFGALSPLLPLTRPGSDGYDDAHPSRKMDNTKIYIPYVRAGGRFTYPVTWNAGPEPGVYTFGGATETSLATPEAPAGVAQWVPAGAGAPLSGPWAGGEDALAAAGSSEACGIGLKPSSCTVAAINAGMNAIGLTPLGPVTGCVAGILSGAVFGPLLGVCAALDGNVGFDGWGSVVDTSATFFSKFLGIATACGTGVLSKLNPLASWMAFAGAVGQAVTECVDPETAASMVHFVEVRASADPNAKVGPSGAGAGNHLQGDRSFAYAVLFENKPEATAAAQEVVITDQLDTDAFDLSTFAFGSVFFGETRVELPPGTDVTADVDLRPATNLIVRIHAVLDAQTGVVTWRFTSLDPLTGAPTTDVFAGFLPPNVTSPEGEGRVTFFVSPKAGLAHGTEIRNDASIVFDVNEPIITNEWLVTIDIEPPSSAVHALAPAQSSSSFQVDWSGVDDGAGIQDYTVYFSENGGPFNVWIPYTPSTSATFRGTPGVTYRFRTVARDGAGNVESDVPADGDTTTTVALADVAFAAEGYVVNEGDGTSQVVVARSGNADIEVSVNYASMDVSAAGGEDYVPVQGTLTFAPGQTVAAIDIAILDDAVWEAEESFVVTLSGPSLFGQLGTPASTTVTIVDDDNRAPVADAGADRTVEATSATGAMVALNGSGSIDADGDALTYQWSGAFGTAEGVDVVVPLPLGTSVITLEVNDGQGGSATDSIQIAVVDTTAPAIAVPADLVVEATSAAGAVATFAAMATDAVSEATLSYAPASGSTFPLGATMVTVTATDAAGNVASATFTVTVVDTTAPVLPALPAVQATVDDEDGGPVSYAVAAASDLVDGAVALVCAPASGSTFPVGDTVVSCTATDGAGNVATGGFVVTVTVVEPPEPPSVAGVLVTHAPQISGTIEGTLQIRLPQSVAISGNAGVTGDLLVPGTPTVRRNGQPRVGAVVEGDGLAQPASHVITLNGQAAVGRIVRRTDAVSMPVVPAPLGPAGTRSVVLSRAGDTVGDWATVRHLTVSGSTGAVAVPAGAYGAFVVNGQNRLVLGVAGATTPAVYHFQSLTLNAQARLELAGPVVVTVGTTMTVGASVGHAAHPEWLTLGIHAGGVTLSGGAQLHGTVLAPNGTVTVNGNAVLAGAVAADRVVVNGSGRIRQR